MEKVSEVRHIIENEIAALAAARRTEADLVDTRGHPRRDRRHVDEPEVYIKSDVAFHAALARATQNELFVIVLDSLVEIMIEVRLLALRVPASRRCARTTTSASSRPYAPVIRAARTRWTSTWTRRPRPCGSPS